MESAKRRLARAKDQSVRKAGVAYEQTAKRRIVRDGAVASAELFRAIDSDVRTGNTVSSVDLLAGADHAGYVEHGIGERGDGTYPESPRPPTWRILEWGMEKPDFTFQGPPWAVAASIADDIEQHGIDEQPFFEPGVGHAKVAVRQELTRAFESSF